VDCGVLCGERGLVVPVSTLLQSATPCTKKRPFHSLWRSSMWLIICSAALFLHTHQHHKTTENELRDPAAHSNRHEFSLPRDTSDASVKCWDVRGLFLDRTSRSWGWSRPTRQHRAARSSGPSIIHCHT
jgi:hypothetical protein